MAAELENPEPSSEQTSGGWTRRVASWEDRFHRFRQRLARRRGLVPVVVPYSGYGGPGWIRVLGRVVLARPVKDDTARQHTDPGRIRGWRSFVSIPVAHSDVTVTADGQEFLVRADRGGVIDVDVMIGLEPGVREISMKVEESDAVRANVFVADPDARVGIVSDIDDTVMVTALPRPFLAAWNTFVLDEHARRPVPGMAVLLERLAREHTGAPIVYVSTGAWNVAPTLARFLGRHLYPAGPLLLTDWGPTHDRLFRSGREHKRESLARLAREFPHIQWVLIGDDGQHDEELYREFATAHPDNVAAVAIRQLSTPEAVLAGGRSHAEDGNQHVGGPWVWAPDGAGLAERLTEVGILPR